MRAYGVLLVGSANAIVGFDAAIAILLSGGSALDAVEAAIRLVEDNPDDHTVGYGGYPNLLGEVELDASIMDGESRRSGAVGALKSYRAAITVARAVMERTPHVLLVGDGAARLAAEIGLHEEDLLTEQASRVWRDGVEGKAPEGSVAAWMLSQLAALATDPEKAGGTVDVIARDQAGHIASGVSTSGWAWKYPGRLGDSPIIGAGNYADDRYGACGCTGFGELAIRSATAARVLAALSQDIPLDVACEAAIRDLSTLGLAHERIGMSLVAIDVGGAHCGTSTRAGAEYVVWTDDMSEPELLPRTHIAL